MNANDAVNRDPNTVSRIAVGMSVLKGEVTTTNDIRIDGDFEGKIACKGRIIVGESANLKGDIICKNFDVYGQFEGSATVGDTFALKTNSHAKGIFKVNKLLVEIGSCYDGETKMISEDDYKKTCAEDNFMNEGRPSQSAANSPAKPAGEKADQPASNPLNPFKK